MHHFYIYFVLAAIIAFYLIINSDSRYKFELFFLSFYLLTGRLNELLSIKIPGFDLFEIQPHRFLFLLLLFFIIRKTLLSRERLHLTLNRKIPWFQVALFSYVIWVITSVLVNFSEIGTAEALKKMFDAVAFLVIMIALQLMADKPSYDLIGKSIIIGAVVSSIVSLVQFSIEPYFLRIGEDRPAFDNIVRSNGIFDNEYFNAYYLIVAIAWTLTTVKNDLMRISMVTLFSLGVLSSFQRMSWIILVLVLITYLVNVKKIAIEKLLVASLSCIAVLLSLSIFYYQDIMNSTLVKERLSEGVEGRQGYYGLVLDNIGEKPIFGYGGLNNEVYKTNILRITRDRERGTLVTGDLHSGYFSALFYYGIPAFICFTLFVIMSVFYYSRSFSNNLYFVIPFLVGIIYMIGNLTNTFLFLKYLSILYAIHIGIGMGIKRMGEQSASKN